MLKNSLTKQLTKLIKPAAINPFAIPEKAKQEEEEDEFEVVKPKTHDPKTGLKIEKQYFICNKLVEKIFDNTTAELELI